MERKSSIIDVDMVLQSSGDRPKFTGKLDVDELYSMLDPKSPDKLASFGGVEGVAEEVGCSPSLGLSQSQVEQNKTTFGTNELPPAHFKSFLALVWDALKDKTLIMLIIAAAISLGIGIATEGPEIGWKDGVAVLVAVVIVVLITSINDYQKEKQFRKLNDVKNDRQVNVIRDGERRRVSIFDLVVGDIVILETGDIIPADGVFLKGDSMQTDESSATGESHNIKKGTAPERDPFFLSGTQLVAGGGQMVVVAVGENSFYGRIMLSLRTPAPDTPLQEKLAKLANIIGNFGIFASLFIFIVQLIKYFAIEGSDVDRDDALNNTVDFLVIAITIVVVAVPEGLPLSVTIALAYSMKFMMKDNNLVRHLDACETMGGATTVCSDKTGTLTQNKMTVVEGSIFGVEFSEEKPFPVSKTDSSNPGNTSEMDQQAFNFFLESIAVNSTAYETQDDKGIDFVGSKTECALLAFGKLYGLDYSKVRDERPTQKVYSFSSAQKRMTTITGSGHPFVNNLGSSTILHTKGAAEVILEKCSQMVDASGKIVEISDQKRQNLDNQLKQMGEEALRTICLAFKPVSDTEDHTNDDEPQLILLGIVGIRDPLRPEVRDAVKACQDAGVVVRMVTGDSKIIARNISQSCGILDESQGHIVMEGPDFRELSDKQLKSILPKLRVLARSSPTDKFRLVSALQSLREVVAVTGDGVNDGPALKKADVGFSMGLSGTDVAKEASAIVLLDDNFASIVNAIKWGRSVFDNIRKFLQFQLTVNFTAILLLFITIMADTEGNAENAPLKPVQLLWINLIMDSFAAIALSTEPASDNLLKFKPYDRNEPLITNYMGRHMVLQIILQTTTFLVITYLGDEWFGTEKQPGDTSEGQFSVKHYTVVFNAFVLSQLFNQFNARKLHQEVNVFSGLHRHRIFIFVWLFALVVQVLIVEFGGDVLEVEALDGMQWLGCIVTGLLPLVWGFLFHILPRSITTEPWPWFDRMMSALMSCLCCMVCYCCCFKKRRDDEEEEEEEDTNEETSFNADHALTVEDVDGTEPPSSSDISKDEPPSPASPLQVSQAQERWSNAIWSVMQQIQVVDTFRRHHR